MMRSQVREGVYLFENGIDPYSGGVFRQVSIVASSKKTLLRNILVTTALGNIFNRATAMAYCIRARVDPV